MSEQNCALELKYAELTKQIEILESMGAAE
jgi:hypothetical protein